MELFINPAGFYIKKEKKKKKKVTLLGFFIVATFNNYNSTCRRN